MSRSWDIFKTINEFNRFSDTKAGVILAFAGGSAAFLSTKVDLLHTIIAKHVSDAWGPALYWAILGYLVALVVTLFSALRSIWPSMGNGERRSLIYFKHIAEDYAGDHGAYAKAIGALDDAAMDEELAHQICANAVITKAKFDWVSRAARALVWVVGLWAWIMILMLLLGAQLDTH